MYLQLVFGASRRGGVGDWGPRRRLEHLEHLDWRTFRVLL